MSYPNGDIYDGQWSHNKKNGYGVQKFAKGDIYKGNWVNDKMHGQGEILHADGSRYEGQFFEGEKVHGEGYYNYKNGNMGRRANYTLNNETHQVHLKQLE
jgi:hypothetical protein